MQNYLIIGGSSGIGQELAIQLFQSGNQVFATFNKSEPRVENTDIHFHHLNVLEDTLYLDFLPDELAGLAYCPGSINLRHFERIKPVDFETDYKLQVIGAIKLIQLINEEWNHIAANGANIKEQMLPGSIEEFIFKLYYGYTKKNEQHSQEYKVNHPRWQVNKVIDYSIFCDFKSMYGNDFFFLNHHQPDSVILAEGSPVTVNWNRTSF